MNILLIELFLEIKYKNVGKIGNQCKLMYHKLESFIIKYLWLSLQCLKN